MGSGETMEEIIEAEMAIMVEGVERIAMMTRIDIIATTIVNIAADTTVGGATEKAADTIREVGVAQEDFLIIGTTVAATEV